MFVYLKYNHPANLISFLNEFKKFKMPFMPNPFEILGLNDDNDKNDGERKSIMVR